MLGLNSTPIATQLLRTDISDGRLCDETFVPKLKLLDDLLPNRALVPADKREVPSSKGGGERLDGNETRRC